MDERPASPIPEPSATPPAQPGQTPETADSAEQRLELAVRLLVHQRRAAAGDLRLLPGRLPPDVPLSLPLPAGARVIGSMTETHPPEPPATTILIDAPLTPEESSQFYIERLNALGWPQEIMPPMRGGFVHVQPGGFSFLRFRSEATGYALMLSAAPAAREGETTLSFMLRTERGPLGAPGRLRPGGPHDLETLIPPLMPPPGASQQHGGGGGGDGRWHSQARLETSLPIAEVTAHYDQQLTRGGWQRQSGGVAGPAGWSFWSFTGAEGAPWRGSLLALNTPDRPHDYLVLLQIEAEDRPNQSQSSFSYSPLMGR